MAAPVAGGPQAYVLVEAGVTLGGAGGAGGDVQFGEAPETSGTAQTRVASGGIRTATLSSEPPKVCGGDGADGPVQGGPGGAAVAILRDADVPPTAGAFGWSAQAQGGNGGFALASRAGSLDEMAAILMSKVDTHGGAGGTALAVGGPGANGAAGADGGLGGSAHAHGGDGRPAAGPAACHSGPGGNAIATGGRGGNGGHNCSPPGRGGDGGNGGTGYAIGGHSPEPGAAKGGDATAIAGAGGDGGNGNPPGAGGVGLASCIAWGGDGNPHGTRTVQDGATGNPGHTCPTTGKPKIIGRVTDKLGAGVRSLDVKWAWKYAVTEPRGLGRVTPSQAGGFVTTDANGSYTVPNLDSGVYWIEPMGDPGGPDYWNPPARWVQVTSTDMAGQDFQLATATTRYAITVQVINDNTGYGVPGERVRLTRGTVGSWELTTDAAGNATFTGLWPGVYTALPPDTTTYTYQPISIGCILLDRDLIMAFRVTPAP